MPSPAYQRILVAALGLLLLLLFLIPVPAEGVQENWLDRIARRVQTEQHLASREAVSPGYERYLTQLHSVQQGLLRGQVSVVQTEMSHLVQMVATKEGGLSDSSAQSLLLFISEVTPGEYLDETTKSHLRLIRAMMTFRSEASEEVSAESAYGLTVPPQTAPWGWKEFGWMGKGTVHPIVTLGAGVLVLIVIGAIVLLFVGAGTTSANSRSADHSTDRTVQWLEKKNPSTGSPRDAARRSR